MNINWKEILEVLPEEVIETPNWIAFKLSPKKDGAGLNKFPLDVKCGYEADVSDPETWADVETATRFIDSGKAHCLGWRMPDDVGMLDYDKILNIGENRKVNSYARQSESYNEYSPSGNGLHSLGRITSPVPSAYKELFEGGLVEVYKERFTTITADIHPDSRRLMTDLTPFIQEHFPDAFKVKAPVRLSAIGGVTSLDDAEVIRRAEAGRSAKKFRDLWNGETALYQFDHSCADEALVCLLTYWCNGDVNQIDRLFRQSGLYRTKWDKLSYRNATMRKALTQVTERFEK